MKNLIINLIIRILTLFIFSSKKRKSFRNKYINKFSCMNYQFCSTMPLFYLKVNRTDEFAIKCLQHWIDIINCLQADFVIICDKDELEELIHKKVHFYNYPKIIKSYKKPLHHIVDNICRTKFWRKATYAHLSTFYHAKLYNLKKFWNIDADDTMIMLTPERASELILKAQHYAVDNNIDAFSLDMHSSENYGINWTWGITYVNNEKDWWKHFNNINNWEWQNKYLKFEKAFNSDCYMTYLRDCGFANCIHFYSENLYFSHYANITCDFFGLSIYHWENNRLNFPLLSVINSPLSEIPINNDCVNLDIEITKSESEEFMKTNFFMHEKLISERLRWTDKI